MHLPESERVIYGCNPLIQVACQLRFPPILKISRREPVDYQDSIRSEYPLFEPTIQHPFPNELAKVAQQFGVPLVNSNSYSFTSEDQLWQLSIAQDSISLTTSAYERFEQLELRFQQAVAIFEDIYKPSFYSRLGLQYQNLIIRSTLNLDDKQWSDLISSRFAAELHDSELSASIQSIMKNIILNIDGGKVNLKHELVNVREQDQLDDESAYLIDADLYTEQKIECGEDVWNSLKKFNRAARNLFRASITDTLHKSMQPQAIAATF
jgi:uncharacterized protein (TIGR04255 family)